MELTFNKVGKQYEAEFELTADANLHIEFENATPVKLYQRTTGSGWDLVNDVKKAVGKATDVDLQALIYPKFIKVVCPSNPSYCEVTSDGEVTEIKSQAKVVEITSNGTTSVEPDAGFSYLSKVDVKTNVPMSGESASSVEYLDMSGVDWNTEVLTNYAQLVKFKMNNDILLDSVILHYLMGRPEVLAIKIDFSDKVGTPNRIMPILDILLGEGLSADQLAAIPRISESEFYNLES